MCSQHLRPCLKKPDGVERHPNRSAKDEEDRLAGLCAMLKAPLPETPLGLMPTNSSAQATPWGIEALFRLTWNRFPWPGPKADRTQPALMICPNTKRISNGRKASSPISWRLPNFWAFPGNPTFNCPTLGAVASCILLCFLQHESCAHPKKPKKQVDENQRTAGPTTLDFTCKKKRTAQPPWLSLARHRAQAFVQRQHPLPTWKRQRITPMKID